MKNLSLRLLSVVAILAVLFSSCSKDSLSKPSSSSQVSKKHSTNDPIPGTGSVQAVLSSSTALRMSLVAINEDDGTTSSEVFADQNGFVEIDGLAEGPYTIVAHAYVPAPDNNAASDVADITITMNSVKVFMDQITDLGTITFGQ